MKTILSLFTLLLLPCASFAAVTTQTITFHSKALDKETTYIAVLPSPLKPNVSYPVLYLLHGATGNYRNWDDKTSLTLYMAERDMIVITPDGSEYGWYLDSPIKPESQYDSAISRDVVADVDSRFPTIADRSGRAIAGLSMGGHGALSLAAKHPDIFSSASSLSGILDITAHSGSWQMQEILGAQPQALNEWMNHSVFFLAENFTTASVKLLFDTGTEDATGAVADSRRVHLLLKSLGVDHTYREFPGVHNWVYWNAHLPEHLDFHQQNISKPKQNQ